MTRRSVLITLVACSASWILAGCSATHRKTPAFIDTPVFDPPTLHLTWDADPTTTMSVQWIGDNSLRDSRVHYAAVGGGDWKSVEVRRSGIPSAGPLAQLHRAHISGLSPGTDYRFRVTVASPEYRFRTAPATLEKPITFVCGGDAAPTPITKKSCAIAASHDPLFAALGGDLAYCNGTDFSRWVGLLSIWGQTMRTDDGRLIPLLVSIGNHEVKGGFDRPREDAPFFLAFFALFKDRSFAALDFGDYMSMLMLDTNHTETVVGEQTDFLAAHLASRARVPHLFALYHVPMYPSHRDFDGATSKQMREHWAPLFESRHLAAAFENHDHTYKRTHPIKAGEINPAGVLYLGDGAWGVATRTVKSPDEAWYLAHSAAVNHVIVTTIDATHRTHRVFDTATGQEIDRHETTSTPAATRTAAPAAAP